MRMAYELHQRGAWHHYRQNKADNIEAQRFRHHVVESEEFDVGIDPQRYPRAVRPQERVLAFPG